RPGRDQVDPDVLLAEVAGQVAGGGGQPGLGHAHPVVDGVGDAVVEVQGHHRAAVLHQRQQCGGERLEGEGGGVHGGGDVLPAGVEEVAAERLLGGEADGVHDAVEPVDVLGDPPGEAVEVLV